MYDAGEVLEILKYRSGELKILVTSEAGYTKHLNGMANHFNVFVGTVGVGFELNSLFLNGAPRQKWRPPSSAGEASAV
jgi:hypothetical protein